MLAVTPRMGPGERLVYLNLECRAEWFQRTNLSNLSTTFFPSPRATCVPGLLPQTRAVFSCQPVGPPETHSAHIHFWSDATGGQVSSLINTNPASSRTLISAGAVHPTTQCGRQLELWVRGCFPRGKGDPKDRKAGKVGKLLQILYKSGEADRGETCSTSAWVRSLWGASLTTPL